MGPPSDWPEDRDSAMLDRSYELAGLGINSDTSEDENAAGEDGKVTHFHSLGPRLTCK